MPSLPNIEPRDLKRPLTSAQRAWAKQHLKKLLAKEKRGGTGADQAGWRSVWVEDMLEKDAQLRGNPANGRKRFSSPKRISTALSRFLKRQNPAFKRASGVRVQKLKGGVIKLTPM